MVRIQFYDHKGYFVFQLLNLKSLTRMSYIFVPPVDDALDTNIHDLDSSELSDDKDIMSNAETVVFSTTRSSSLEPDTTTKFVVQDQTTQHADNKADNTDYSSILTHPQVAKLIFALASLVPFTSNWVKVKVPTSVCLCTVVVL